jgi:polyphosphate kinase 2 (PPK2 family)
MAKKAKRHHKGKAKRADQAGVDVADSDSKPTVKKPKMKKKEYEQHMRVLQGELVAMQEWVKATGAKVCIVFEGLDSAGKGGTIRRITERTSRGSSNTSRCPHRPNARSRRCTSSGTSRTSRRRVRWPSSTAVGTTVPAWSR